MTPVHRDPDAAAPADRPLPVPRTAAPGRPGTAPAETSQSGTAPPESTRLGTARPRAAAAPGAPHPAGRLDVSVCRDPVVFAELAPEWDRLFRTCPEATPFQSHAWLHSWWLSYGTPGRLRLVLVRGGDGQLLGVAPLMRTYAPVPGVVALGGAITDHTDVLVAGAPATHRPDADRADADAPGPHRADADAPDPHRSDADAPDPHRPDAERQRDAVAAALAAGMCSAARGGVVDLREVRAGAAAERVHAMWRGPRRRLADSMCLELPGCAMDGLIARVGSARGQKIRAALRRLEAVGIEEYEVAPDATPAAVATLLRLHRMQWQDRGMTPEHGRTRFAEHLTRACTRMVAAGDAAVTEFRRGGRTLAVDLTLLSPRMSAGYLVGVHPDLRAARVDLTTLLMRHGVGMAYGGGRDTLSLLRGDEPHKSHWRPEQRPNQRFLLAAPAAAPALHTRRLLAAARTAAAASPRLRAARTRLTGGR